MDGEAVKREILTALEYSYAHDDWVEPLPEALAGVMPQEAAWQPDPNGRSIWAIVLHLALWHENMVARMQSGRPVRPEEGSWPALPPVLDEAAWEHAQKRLGNSLDALRAQIKATPPEALLKGPLRNGRFTLPLHTQWLSHRADRQAT